MCRDADETATTNGNRRPLPSVPPCRPLVIFRQPKRAPKEPFSFSSHLKRNCYIGNAYVRSERDNEHYIGLKGVHRRTRDRINKSLKDLSIWQRVRAVPCGMGLYQYAKSCGDMTVMRLTSWTSFSNHHHPPPLRVSVHERRLILR